MFNFNFIKLLYIIFLKNHIYYFFINIIFFEVFIIYLQKLFLLFN